jgi:hypothetical protein
MAGAPFKPVFGLSGDFDFPVPSVVKRFPKEKADSHCSTNTGDTPIVIVCPAVTAVTFPLKSR